MASHEIADAFAELLISEDWDAAHDLVAPWLSTRWTPAALARAVRNAVKDCSGPAVWALEISPLQYDDLLMPDGMGPPTEELPTQLKRSRFRDWICIHFTPAEEERKGMAGCFDIWVATAEVNSDLWIGYLEFAEAT